LLEKCRPTADGGLVAQASAFAPPARGTVLQSLDARGKVRWTWQTADHVTDFATAPGGHTFLATSAAGRPPRVLDLDAWGTEVARYEGGYGQAIRSLRLSPRGALSVLSSEGLVALDADLQVRWKVPLRFRPDDFFHVVDPDGGVVLASNGFSLGMAGTLHAFDAQGHARSVDWPPVSTFPATRGDQMVYGGVHSRVHGVNLTTGRFWTVMGSDLYGAPLQTPVYGPDGTVVVTDRRNMGVVAISSDGRLLWTKTVVDAAPVGGVRCAFQPGLGGSVFYRSRDGFVRQIREDGREGGSWRPDDGLVDFSGGPEGKLYMLGREGTMTTVDPAFGQVSTVRTGLPHPQSWSIEEVLPEGVVALQWMGERWHLQPEPGEALRKALDPSAGRAEAPRIERTADAVIIGGVRVPINPGKHAL